MKKLLLSIILFLSLNPAKALTFDCYIAHDHLLSSTEYVFDVYIASTDSDFLFRSFQGCFTFDSNFVSPNATVVASYDALSTQLINYMPGTCTYSSTAPGFMVNANISLACINGTLISNTPVRIGTFRMTITSPDSFNCVSSNPNMALPGETAAGLALRTSITKWNDPTCAVGINSSITANGTFTQFIPQTLYDSLNNMAPMIVSGPVNDTVCRNETATFTVGAAALPGYGPIQYQWYENGSPAADGMTPLGTYSGVHTSTLTIDFASSPLDQHTFYCMVYQCNVINTVTATLTVINATVNLGTDIILPGPQIQTLDAGAGFASYLWSTGETTQTISAPGAGDYWVSVIDINGCTASDTINIIISDVSDLSSDNIRLFPNPSKDQVFITGINNVNDINAVNSLGEIIKLNFSFESNDIRVNTSELAAGIYYLQLYCDDKVIVKQLQIE